MSDGHGKSAASPPVIPGTTNYGVNDRTWSGYIEQYNTIASSQASPTPSAYATRTLSYTAATGGSIAYEWQFLTYDRFQGTCGGPTTIAGTPLVGSTQYWNGPASYNDSISGASSNSITLTAYPYTGTFTTHSIAGFWRLKASNSAGATYTRWTLVGKEYGNYNYNCNLHCPPGPCEIFTDCNCTCPCGTYNCNGHDCNCQCDCQYDENNQPYDCTTCCDTCYDQCCNCSEQCDSCFYYCNCAEVYDTCTAYAYYDLGQVSGCNW